jgi:hypothetical protein
MNHRRIRHAIVRSLPVAILVLLLCGLDLRAGGGGEPFDGIKSEPGMKPFAWPKELAGLPFDKTTRYRNGEIQVRAFLDTDDSSRIELTQGDKVITKPVLFDSGQFAILAVDSPLPVFQAWGERYDGLLCRQLLVPERDGERLVYRLCYTEAYTTNRQSALSPEKHEVQLRAKDKKREAYFLGHLKLAEPKDAALALDEAREFRWPDGGSQTNQVK